MAILLIFTLLLIALLLIGTPVAYSIGITSVTAVVIYYGIPDLSFGLITQMIVYGINNFPILAVPLFLLVGSLMNEGGISKRIFDFAGALVGHIRGGLAHVNILASFIFSGISGAAAADVAGLGQIEIKSMKDAGYDKEFSCAITGASAIIGPIVPPSIPLILFGVLANTSVSKLFVGGILPGVLLVIAFMILSYIIAKKRNYPVGDRLSMQRIKVTFKHAALPLMLPVIIIGGIWGGVFTPTEAAAVAALFALVLGVFVYKEIKPKMLVAKLKETSVTSSSILIILACAMIYNNALNRTHIPEILINSLSMISASPLVIMIMLNFVLFCTGCFMSTATAISLLTPLLAPLLIKFGIDPVHFGIVMVLNLMLGQLTPPFGIVLYVLTLIEDIDFNKLVRACLPFYIPIVVVLILIILIPTLVTLLPGLFLN